jgi:hypothetical protein
LSGAWFMLAGGLIRSTDCIKMILFAPQKQIFYTNLNFL